MIENLILFFSSSYNYSTGEHTYPLVVILIDQSSSLVLLYAFLRSLMTSMKINGKSTQFNSGLLGSSVPSNERSTLISTFVVFISYMLSSGALHTYSLFNTGQPSGSELYLFYIAMDSITIILLVLGHTYIRCRYSFTSELLALVMLASGLGHLLLYTAYVNYYAGDELWGKIYDIVSLFFIALVNGGSITLIAVCLIPNTLEKAILKLVKSYKTLASKLKTNQAGAAA